MFKKIHEGLDLFNYYFSRHEASSNDSQREKLEGDLKKEIKKLQKFRDQIKTWQGNDSLEATIASLKLYEHRRLVEEAMECYKEVEKNSKMKSFSNQSIMLAAMDNGEHLTPEVQEAVEFLDGILESLSEQNESLDEEYEKLSQKKIRKSNMLAIEERKQEIDTFKSKNEFHIESIEKIMRYLKEGKVSVDLIWTVQDDLTFYVESNQEPDFIDDETVYDEIIREAKDNSAKNVTVSNGNDDLADTSLLNGLEDLESAAPETAVDFPNRKQTASSSPAPQEQSSQETPAKSASLTAVTPKGKEKSHIIDISSPAFITTLKPASTPSKPVGALKWSVAAGGHSSAPNAIASKQAAQVKVEEKTAPEVPKDSNAAEEFHNQKEADASSELLSLLTKNDEYSPYLEVLKNSALPQCELELFGDLNLLRVPPGIQDFSVSYTASNKAKDAFRFLSKPKKYNPFGSLILKPYLPQGLFSADAKPQFKPPLFVAKIENYWNRIRASNQFEQFLKEIESLKTQNTPESATMINELTMVLFYGYYYGYLPLENIIAESLLHKLGWMPYGLRPEESGIQTRPELKKQFQYWFKPTDESASLESISAETGDFKVFDLSLWEIYVKYGVKFDPLLSRSEPCKSLL